MNELEILEKEYSTLSNKTTAKAIALAEKIEKLKNIIPSADKVEVYEKSYWFLDNKLTSLVFASDDDFTETELEKYNLNKKPLTFQNVKGFATDISEKLKNVENNCTLKIFEVIYDGKNYLRISSKGSLATYKSNATKIGKKMLSTSGKLQSI